MGTITRAFANNITTSGVFKPGAFNNASFDNVTSVPAGSVEAGNMVLLSTQTASSSASISFTSGLDSTYSEYLFIFNNVHPSATNPRFTFNASSDGGSNYNVIKTSTHFRANHNEGGTDANFSYNTGMDLAQSTAYQPILEYVGSANDTSGSGFIHLFEPSSTTYVKHFICSANHFYGTDYSNHTQLAGYFNTTSAINAIDFKYDSGNIDDGTIQMFGIK